MLFQKLRRSETRFAIDTNPVPAGRRIQRFTQAT